MQIEIYPVFHTRYHSLYLQGLISLFGRSRLKFTARGFPRFAAHCVGTGSQRVARPGSSSGEGAGLDESSSGVHAERPRTHYLALRVRGEVERKIFIHSDDWPDLDEVALDWCDVFGKVNLDPALVPEEYESKIMALGPTMHVRVWGPIASIAAGLRTYLASPSACGGLRQHLRSFRGHYGSGTPETEYRPTVAPSDYIFYNAALWEREPEANALRARFVEAARSVEGIRFEGGLTPRDSGRSTRNYYPAEYEPYVCRRYTPQEYFAKTRISTVVMNNPAYAQAHSWRLAEYLAMGKAIISTPLARSLPAPLVHGAHIHYVDGSVEGYRSAIAEICYNDDYRSHLERNARAYYETYLSPTSVMRRIFRRARIDLDPPDNPASRERAAAGEGKVWERSASAAD